jgi:hypothetical protein
MILRRGKTTDNVHLAQAYLDTLFALYGATTLGAQELEGEMLDVVQGATADADTIEDYRVTKLPVLGRHIRWARIISVDPSVAEKPNDECGIVVIYAPLTQPVLNRHAYVVDDLSLKGSPTVWGDQVVKAAVKHNAVIVVENNQGGALVRRMIKERAAAHNVPAAEDPRGLVGQGQGHARRADRRRLPARPGAPPERAARPGGPADQLDPGGQGLLPRPAGRPGARPGAVLFPKALTKGGMPGASTSHSPVGTRVPRDRVATQRRSSGLRIDTNRGINRTGSGIVVPSGFLPGLAAPRRTVGGHR